MKPNHCSRESEVVIAARSGASNPELDRHLATCAACSETQHLTAAMLRYATSVRAEAQQPPTASRIWRRAQAQKQELLLKRATGVLSLMQALGAIYLTVLIAWGARIWWQQQGAEMTPAWNLLADGQIFLGAGVAFVSVLFGACLLLLLGIRADRSYASS
jgi:predicted anti-sigma-YlaC factor YlaD